MELGNFLEHRRIGTRLLCKEGRSPEAASRCNTCTCVFVCVGIHAYVYTYLYIYKYGCMCTCVYIYIYIIQTYISMNVEIRISKDGSPLHCIFGLRGSCCCQEKDRAVVGCGFGLPAC